MKQVVIENPVINSPFGGPVRHFKFDDDGITDQIIEQRRVSCYFVPIAHPRKKTKQKQETFDGWTADRIEENKLVNQIRQRVAVWRGRGYPNITRTSRLLLDYWRSPQRNLRLFFCQIEALETVIYITEAARHQNDQWIENRLREEGELANPGLFRIAFKLATGTGKTVVMAMLIAWHSLNKLANPQDARFSDAFLLATPGITIRDRLRVLLPNDPGNYYKGMEIVPPDLLPQMGRARIIVTNFHAFLRREKIAAGKLTKEILNQNDNSAFTESAGEMAARVLRGLGNKKNLVVINDEAHHCYRRKTEPVDERLTGDERKEAEANAEKARVWISGLEAVQQKTGIRAIYDLSATPFFLRGSGYAEGTLFPWVVSDFSLIDAIESGVVKVPRVPVADDSMAGELPTYREIWPRIRENLPKKGRSTQAADTDPRPPAELEGALQSLYANYAKSYDRWEAMLARSSNNGDHRSTPPVFIVVCNNTSVSKMVFDYIAGYEKPVSDDTTVLVPGKLPLFSNVQDSPEGGRFVPHPNTILVDSEQLESGEAMSDDFKKIAAIEIAEFKAEYRIRFPDRDPDQLTDEDLLREVLNTVGKPGKLGENIKCVVSVSMLTEGWDANTVTHILGVRAFGTQLLCEQVVGRGLRRRSYSPLPSTITVNGRSVEIEAYPVEYAEVYGVPFSFIPCSGSGPNPPPPGPQPTHVRALPERAAACEITFPRLDGYRYELGPQPLAVKFTDASRLTLSTQNVPTKTENAPIVGETVIHDLSDLKSHRPQEIAFLLAKLVLERYFRADGQKKADKPKQHQFDSEVQVFLFPQVLQITRKWLDQCVTCKDNTFPQLLLLIENAYAAADRIYNAIVAGDPGPKRLIPIPKPYDTVGSTALYSAFDTVRSTYRTHADKCHISHVVADTDSWEQKLAQTLEDMESPRVLAYVKNDMHLGFAIPYTIKGAQKAYYPDFIALVDDAHGPADPLHLIIEVTGERDLEKEAKVSTTKTLWVPAVNNAGTWGRWAFVEIDDPWDSASAIRSALLNQSSLSGTPQ